MASRRRRVLIGWGLPLLMGPLLAIGAVVWLDRTLVAEGPLAHPPAITDFGRPVERVDVRAPRRPPSRTADGRAIVDLGNRPPPGLRTGAAVNDPLLAAGQEIGSAPPPDFDVLYRRVTVLDSTHFRVVVDNVPVIVQLAGVEGPAFDAVCTDDAKARWKCGARGRAELARLIGPRSVGCREIVDTGEGTRAADCYAGVNSLSEWVVAQGWADPIDPYDQRFRPLADAARLAGKGRLQRAPRPLP